MSNGEELAVGRVLDDKYVIEELIGRGGMGAVYRARHVRLDSPRAIKIVRPELAQDISFIRRFRNEALLAEGVRHPNVVALYDFSTLPDGTSYIVWEYVEGATIGQLLSRGVVFTETEVVTLIENVADGLVTAHRQGILHRDVSPDNIMICSAARGARTAKLLDFGVAKGGGIPAETPTDADLCFGKVGYASPEQMGLLKNDEPLDERTDVFSLAAVTFAMLVGESPFDSSSMQAFIHDLMIAPEAEVRGRFLERLAEPWRKPLSRALARDRKVRTPTVEQFIAGMKRAATETTASGTLEQKPVSPKWLYASAMVVVAGVVALTVLSTLLPERSSAPTKRDEGPQVVSTVNGPENGREKSPDVPRIPRELSPKEVSETAPRSPESATESPSVEETAPRVAAELEQGPTQGPVEHTTPPAGNEVGDHTKRQVEEPQGSTMPDREAGTEENESRSETTPPEPRAPSSSGEHSEGVGTVVEDDTSRQTTPTPPQVTEPRVISRVEPKYPAVARRLLIEGVVTLEVVVSPRGDVTDWRVVNSIHPALDKAAINAVRRWRFEPAVDPRGEAVQGVITVQVRFELTS